MEKETKKGRDRKKEYAWNKENKVFIGLSLMKTTDNDIIEYLDNKQKNGESKQGTVKRCIRYAMECEEVEKADGYQAKAEEQMFNEFSGK